ncbi:hypothetical protein FWF48_00455 [Candidatus Saccharibacteria bacterium]|nr:hypothetical protein [Candidatus Saccharibacteria bacterium]
MAAPPATITNWIHIAPNNIGTVTVDYQSETAFTVTGLNGSSDPVNDVVFDSTTTGIQLDAGSGTYSLVVDGRDYQITVPLQVYAAGIALTTSSASPVAIIDQANVTMTVDGNNTFTATGGGNAGINVPGGWLPDNTLTITSDAASQGSLTATGGNAHIGAYGDAMCTGAGIGGSNQTCLAGNVVGQSAGTINITGYVKVAAHGGDYDPGMDEVWGSTVSIGGGGAASCQLNNVTILGGDGGYISVSGHATVYAPDGIGGGIINWCYSGGNPIAVKSGAGPTANISGQAFVITNNIGYGLCTSDDSFCPISFAGAVSPSITIIGGSVYSLSDSSIGFSSGSRYWFLDKAPTNGNTLVYPLYIPTVLGPSSVSTVNTTIDFSTANPSTNYQVNTLTPGQQSWFSTQGYTFPATYTAVPWLPANSPIGIVYSGVQLTSLADDTVLTITSWADQRPVYPISATALGSYFNHLYSSAPITATNPTDQTVKSGSNVSFSSTIANTAGFSPAYGTPTYQWQVSTDDGMTWSNVVNEVSITLNLTNVQPAMSGNMYRLLVLTPNVVNTGPGLNGTGVSGGVPVITTSPATLTVTSQYITLTSSNNVNINLNPVSSPLGSTASNLSVNTNVPNGYSLSISMSGTDTRLTDGSGHYLNSTTGIFTAPSILGANTWGFAMNSSAAAAGNGFDASYATPVPAGTARFAGVPASTSPLTISTTNMANETGDSFNIYYAANADITMPAGTYTGTVLYTVVGN